jgi:hypothetical protein
MVSVSRPLACFIRKIQSKYLNFFYVLYTNFVAWTPEGVGETCRTKKHVRESAQYRQQ